MNHTDQILLVFPNKKRKKILNFSSTIVWIRLSQRNILIYIYISYWGQKEEETSERPTFAVDKTR